MLPPPPAANLPPPLLPLDALEFWSWFASWCVNDALAADDEALLLAFWFAPELLPQPPSNPPQPSLLSLPDEPTIVTGTFALTRFCFANAADSAFWLVCASCARSWPCLVMLPPPPVQNL